MLGIVTSAFARGKIVANDSPKKVNAPAISRGDKELRKKGGHSEGGILDIRSSKYVRWGKIGGLIGRYIPFREIEFAKKLEYRYDSN